MTAQTILPANTLSSGGFQVNNSVRFNSADSADLRISDYSGAGTSRRIRTYSMWIKRSELSYAVIFGSAGKDHWVFNANNTIQFNIGSGTDSRRVTTRLFTDVTAWYHLVFAYDTTQGTAANRFTLWVNGVETSTAIVGGKNEVQQNEDALVFINNDTHTIGSDEDGASYFDGYMAEWVFVDGQKLDADSFGEFDEDSGIWKPIDVSGITLGTNGFYLDFQTASDLGIDAGNDNDFEPTNLAATDQSTDTCTNNFNTFNPLQNFYAGGAFSEGNLKYVTVSDKHDFAVSTIGMSSGSGKFYAEFKIHQDTDYSIVGISDHSYRGSNQELSEDNYSYGYYQYLSAGSGAVRANGSDVITSMPNFTTNDIIGVAVDLDNHKLYFSKNGTFINSADPTSGSTGTGAASIQDLSSVSTSYGQGVYFFAAGLWNTSAAGTYSANFGSAPYAISSGNQDSNGFGNFEFAVPSGYFALCTKNLAEHG